MLTLRLFGGISLTDSEQPVSGRAAQRRRQVMLAVLGASRGRPVSRDKLIGLLWPESDTERARHALADTVYVLRSAFGDDLFVMTGDDIALNDSRITCDALQFTRAFDAGDMVGAANAYTGPFLDGVHLADAADFDGWMESTRSRLADEYHRALEEVAVAKADRGEHAEAVIWWRKLAADDRLSSRATLGLMRALVAAGDTAGALNFAQIHDNIVRVELDAPPDPAVTAYVNELKTERQKPMVGRSAPGTPRHAQWDASPMPLEAPVPREPSEPSDAARTKTLPLVSRGSRIGPIALGLAALGVVALLATPISNARRAGAHIGSIGASRSARPVSSRSAIAVLSFLAAGSGDASDLADGVTDELTHALMKVRGLRVVARTSTLSLRGKAISATAIGDTLGVRYYVEGSLRRMGTRLRVTAQLIDTRDGTHVWSDEYDRELRVDQVFALEEEIARAIATALKVTLTRPAEARLVGRPAGNLAAYEDYLRGRYFFWNRRDLRGTLKSIEYFQRAIVLDSSFASAHAGLAESYVVMAIGNVGDFDAREFFPKARSAAMRALELDSTLADAHTVVAEVALLYDLDCETSARELSHALALNPSLTTAHIYRSALLEWSGRFPEAVREAQVALELDPLSVVANIELGRSYFFARRYGDAIARLQVAIELDSMSLRAHLHLGQVYEQQGRFDDAIRELTFARARSPSSSRSLALLAQAYAAAGRRTEALRLLAELSDRSRQQYVPALDFAIVHAGFGDRDAAFRWLDRAVADHSIRPFVRDPSFDLLRSDPRYDKLLASLKLQWQGPLD